MTAMRLPLAVSTGFHVVLLAALVFAAREAAVPIPPPKPSFQIAMPPPMARLETVRPVAPQAEPVLKPVEPEAEPVVRATAPMVKPLPEPERRVTAVEPRLKPKPRPRPRPRPRRVERPRAPAPRMSALPPPTLAPLSEPEPRAVAPIAPAPPVAAAPNPAIENGYKLALSRWFEAHKRYPASARDAEEQGSAVVRFRVDRSGRVLSFSLARSTGYPDLDRAVTDLVRGARLPPFPAGLTTPSLEVAVMLRFSLGE
ncbi:MAG: TonB family protein [Stellaceae bacterium]